MLQKMELFQNLHIPQKHDALPIWAEALSKQEKDAELKSEFTTIATALLKNEATIIKELNYVQGKAMNIGGYYLPNIDKTDLAMRPSITLNNILAN